MGPFPHDAPKAVISDENPAGTDGFEFVEFAHPEPEKLDALFRMMGFVPVARHRTKAITLYRQGDINYLLNAEPGSHAAGFVEAHGPCAPAMAWRVVDARHALKRAVELGRDRVHRAGQVARRAGGDRHRRLAALLRRHLRRRGLLLRRRVRMAGRARPEAAGVGFYYLDHLTHNVVRGNMDTWYQFYHDTFNFREIRFFDIRAR